MTPRWLLPVILVLLSALLTLAAWAGIDRLSTESRLSTLEQTSESFEDWREDVKRQLERIEDKLDALRD
jgi:hypothetical protein